MAITYWDRNTLKSYFQEGDFPTEEQFTHFIDSFYHRSSDQAPISFISGLVNVLASKASTDSVMALQIVLQQLAGITELNSFIEKSYGAAKNLKDENKLIAGKFYKITDFRQGYNKYDSGAEDIVELGCFGEEEALIVFATSSNTFAAAAISTVYPADKILYDFDGSSRIWTDGETTLSDLAYPTGADTDIWKGVIYYRHDTLRDISAWFDWKNVKFRSYAITASTWSFTRPYVVGNIVKSSIDGNLYRSKYAVAGGVDPVNNVVQWELIFDIVANKYISHTAVTDAFKAAYSIGPSYLSVVSSDWQDSLMISNPDSHSIHIEKCDYKYLSDFGYALSTPNIIFVNEAINIRIAPNSYCYRFIGSITDYNSSRQSRHMILRECSAIYLNGHENNGLILNECTNLKFDCRAEHSLLNRHAHNKYNGNIIQVGFPLNFRYNFVMCELNTVSFYFSPETVGDYTTTIFKREDGAIKISYIDNLNILQVASLT